MTKKKENQLCAACGLEIEPVNQKSLCPECEEQLMNQPGGWECGDEKQKS